MPKEKRNTIVKKLSTRDYANLLHFLETGDETELDLTAYDTAALAVVEKRSLRLTAEQKVRMDEFLEKMPVGRSFKSFLDTLQKKVGGSDVK